MSKKKFVSILFFILSLTSFIISLNLLWNKVLFADEYNTNPSFICGNNFWLVMDWLRLVLLFLLTVMSLVYIFKND